MGSAEAKANLHTSAADNQHGRLNDSLSLTEMLTVTSPGQSFICTAVPATNMQVHTSAEESQEDPINCNTMYSCNSPVSRSGIYVTFKVNDTLITANISVTDESLIGMNLTYLATYRGDTSIDVTFNSVEDSNILATPTVQLLSSSMKGSFQTQMFGRTTCPISFTQASISEPSAIYNDN